MSTKDEFLTIFDINLVLRTHETERDSEHIFDECLDTISAAESLFKGTVVDFNNL